MLTRRRSFRARPIVHTRLRSTQWLGRLTKRGLHSALPYTGCSRKISSALQDTSNLCGFSYLELARRSQFLQHQAGLITGVDLTLRREGGTAALDPNRPPQVTPP